MVADVLRGPQNGKEPAAPTAGFMLMQIAELIWGYQKITSCGQWPQGIAARKWDEGTFHPKMRSWCTTVWMIAKPTGAYMLLRSVENGNPSNGVNPKQY